MSSRVVEASDAQVLPDVNDQRQTVLSWAASCCVDADHRRKHSEYADLAARLFVKAVPE